MASTLWTIFLNVISAFIYAGLIWIWKNRGKTPSYRQQSSTPPEVPAPEPLDRRVRNRQMAEAVAQRFLFYLITFSTLYLSITLPPLFKALFSKEPVLLSHARVVGEYLPDIPVGRNYLQASFFFAAAILYWPLFRLSEVATSLAYPIVDAFVNVTARILFAIAMIVFLLFCIPIAATSVWLFYSKTYCDSLIIVLFAVFLMFALGQAQNGRR